MGICYCLIRTSEETIDALRWRPKAVAEFIFQDPDIYQEPKQGFLSRMLGLRTKADTGPVPERTAGDEIDLEKAWHIVHYLLCGDTGRGEGPLALIGDDRHPLADFDTGLGKPNVIDAEHVRAFADASAGMTEADFLVRYVPEDMPVDELYLGQVIERGDIEDIREYALENFHRLRDFVKQAAERNQAIITYYT